MEGLNAVQERNGRGTRNERKETMRTGQRDGERETEQRRTLASGEKSARHDGWR